MNALGVTEDRVEVLRHRGLSDHAPALVDLESAPRTPETERPIPKELFATKYFQDYMEAHLGAASWEGLPRR
eukprot:5003362-Pyramimonas_sp.AAC.1